MISAIALTVVTAALVIDAVRGSARLDWLMIAAALLGISLAVLTRKAV